MTLSFLHIRFPTCVVVPLGLDVDLCVGTLWASILLGFLDTREYLWLCDLFILFGTWDYLLSLVGVGHLGSTWSGGSAFSLLPWLEHSLLAFTFIMFIDHYDRWLYLLRWMLYLYSWMDVSCMVDGFIYFIVLVSWIWRGWCISICIFF